MLTLNRASELVKIMSFNAMAINSNVLKESNCSLSKHFVVCIYKNDVSFIERFLENLCFSISLTNEYRKYNFEVVDLEHFQTIGERNWKNCWFYSSDCLQDEDYNILKRIAKRFEVKVLFLQKQYN